MDLDQGFFFCMVIKEDNRPDISLQLCCFSVFFNYFFATKV